MSLTNKTTTEALRAKVKRLKIMLSIVTGAFLLVTLSFTFVEYTDLFLGAVTRAVCGNAELEDPEECDDGNRINGDGCNSRCKTEVCGNGTRDKGEECDDENLENGDGCNEICKKESCGNDVKDANEECDDGNRKNGDGCNSKCKLEVCGNGVRDVGEECDDGNTINGDDCSANCIKEDVCGNGIFEPDNDEQCDDNNRKSGDGCSNRCQIEECGNGVKDRGEECDDGNLTDYDGCSRECLREKSIKAKCGNGIREKTEECDDGNTEGGDGCSKRCKLEACGNGIVDEGEQCDDGEREDGDGCNRNCRKEVCGNGEIDANESCDDGNKVSGDGCSSTCKSERCGNGILDKLAGEECDDGNLDNGDGCSSLCKKEVCGNNILDKGEACDDGNKKKGDGCSSQCELEECGNGFRDPGEACDDGNVLNGDGCSSQCTKEECGNGILDVNEECDDGNKRDRDGCDKTCHIERITKALKQKDPSNLKKHLTSCFQQSFAQDDLEDDPDGDKAQTWKEILDTTDASKYQKDQYADTRQIPKETALVQKSISLPYINKDEKWSAIVLEPGAGNFVGWYNYFGCIKGRVPTEFSHLNEEERKEKGIVREFQPDATITRAEAVKTILGAFNVNVPARIKSNPFHDVSKTDWHAPYIQIISKAKIVQGFPGKQFKPNESISNAAAIKILMEIIGADRKKANPNLIANVVDVPASSWQAPYVALAIEKGIIPYDIAYFHPDAPISRYNLVKYTVLTWVNTQDPTDFFAGGNIN